MLQGDIFSSECQEGLLPGRAESSSNRNRARGGGGGGATLVNENAEAETEGPLGGILLRDSGDEFLLYRYSPEDSHFVWNLTRHFGSSHRVIAW